MKKHPYIEEVWGLWLGVLVVFLWALFILAGCNFVIPKDITLSCPDCTVKPKPEPPAITYKDIAGKVFQPYCLRCHAGSSGLGGVDLSTYSSVTRYLVPGKPEISKLCEVLKKERMPPGSPLSSKLTEDLCQWIAQGAKES